MARRLTAKQAKFADRVASGQNPTKAARDTGFTFPNQEAYRLLRNENVVEHIQQRRKALIRSDLSHLALETMRELMADAERTPAATRFKASEWVLGAAGLGPKADQMRERDGPKDLADMDPDELANAVSSGMQALGELAQQLQGHHVIDGQARHLVEVQQEEEDDDFLS